jgi:5'-nucleotidase
MRALVTNDDGVASEGIATLTRAAVEAGLDVVVAAPSWDSSGASASLTAVERDGRFLFDERQFDDLPDVSLFAVQAAPAFIVRAAMHGAFGSVPDLVLSGVNLGLNTGHAVLHSGTVGAALTASTHGAVAAAFSIDVPGPFHWDTALAVARTVIEWVTSAEPGTVMNVNVPNVPPERLRGMERGALARFGAVQTHVTEVGEGYLKLAFTDVNADREEGTDAALVAAGFASVTPLIAVCEAAAVDTAELVRVATR